MESKLEFFLDSESKIRAYDEHFMKTDFLSKQGGIALEQ